MTKFSVKYAGVSLTELGPEVQKTHPGRRFNYFEIPWNASCPGIGKLLVTSRQLREIESALVDTRGVGSLELSVDGQEDVVLNNICLMRADPLDGHYRTSGSGNFLDNSEGLWVAEIQDYRCIDILQILDRVDRNAYFNIRDVNNQWEPDTLFSIDPDTPWNSTNIIAEIVSRSGISLDTTSFNHGSTTFSNIFGVAIPCLHFLDLYLSIVGGYVVTYDSRESQGQYKIVPLDVDVSSVISSVVPSRLLGGMSRVYSPSIAQKILAFNRNPSSSVFIDRYVTGTLTNPPSSVVEGNLGEPFTDTEIPLFMDSHGVSGSIQPNRGRHSLINSHFSLMGFWGGFLGDYPVSLVTFDWSSIPMTRVDFGVESPSKTLLTGPSGHFLRGVPLRLSIDGNIFFNGQTVKSSTFFGTVVRCNKDAGVVQVEPLKGSILSPTIDPNADLRTVFVGIGSHVRTGDLLFCFSPLGAEGDVAYFGYKPLEGIVWAAPTDPEMIQVQDNPSITNECNDSYPWP